MNKHNHKICRETGYKIRQLRESQHLTQQYIADELGISLTAYGAIERGYTNITLIRLSEIAGILQVDISYFFEDKKSLLLNQILTAPMLHQGAFSTVAIISLLKKIIEALSTL